MGRVKSVRGATPVSRGLAPKSNLYIRRNKVTQSPAKTNINFTNAGLTDVTTIEDDDEEDNPQDDTAAPRDYPSPALTVDRTVGETLEIAARIPHNGRKKYPDDVPRTPRPPYLPPSMQTGCIQTTKFKCLTAPTASAGKPDWDVIKYCLDCLRPHLIHYCDGTHELVDEACSYHLDHPDSTLRINEYERVRKRLEKLYFDHGIIDSRPFSPPVLEHHSECNHQNDEDGFDIEILDKMKETAEWGKDVSQEQLQIAAAAMLDTPRRRAPRPSTPRPPRLQGEVADKGQDKKEKKSTPVGTSHDVDVIMIDD